MSNRHPTSLADALFGRTKKSAIGVLFSRPENSWHLRELARLTSVSPTMLSKEMDALAAAGIVLDERDGNRRRLRANPDCPIFEELKGIARKTSGLADILRESLVKLSGIDFAFIFGSVARGEERSGSDVDVCVVGKLSHRSLVKATSSVEGAIGRSVNPILYSTDELRKKLENQNSFVVGMFSSKRIFLIGDEDALKRSVEEPG